MHLLHQYPIKQSRNFAKSDLILCYGFTVCRNHIIDTKYIAFPSLCVYNVCSVVLVLCWVPDFCTSLHKLFHGYFKKVKVDRIRV